MFFTLYLREDILIHGGSGSVFILFTVSTMSDEETSSGNSPTVSVHTTASNQAGHIHRPLLPQVKPPASLNLADCSAKRWKLWKQTSTLLSFRKFQRKERHTRRLLFFAPSGRAHWKFLRLPGTFRGVFRSVSRPSDVARLV